MDINHQEINEDIFEPSNQTDVEGYFDDQNEDLPKASLHSKGDEKLSVFPNQSYLGNKLFERIQKAFEIYGKDFNQFKSMDFQVKSNLCNNYLPLPSAELT